MNLSKHMQKTVDSLMNRARMEEACAYPKDVTWGPLIDAALIIATFQKIVEKEEKDNDK